MGGPNGRNRSPSQEALQAIVSDADLAEVLNEMVKKGAPIDVDTVQRARTGLKERKSPTTKQAAASSTPQSSPTVAPGNDSNNTLWHKW